MKFDRADKMSSTPGRPASPDALLAECLRRWDLRPDGVVLVTHSSRLLPVRRRDGAAAMLKIPLEDEERRGGALMAWWGGIGAAAVLEHDPAGPLILERATGVRSLAAMARTGYDDAATRILCTAAMALHARQGRPPGLIALPDWFAALAPQAKRHRNARYGRLLGAALSAARELLQEGDHTTVLHGDVHHGNVLDFGERGWLAIDPKGLIGNRTFDFANLFLNPDMAVATRPGRFDRQLAVVAEMTGETPDRLRAWIVAYAGLSAAWLLEDGIEPRLADEVGTIALAHSGRHRPSA
jgi:streptomycin 6-kinase